jgi:hypothetical protein
MTFSPPITIPERFILAIPKTGFGFLRTFLLWLFPVVAVFLALVTVVDPNRHFGGHWFPNIRVAARFDKVRIFNSFRAGGPVTGLILGSSRTMFVSPRILDPLTGKRFFNASVYNAFPEDYLAMYRTLVKRGATPEMLLIGVDDDHLDGERPFDQEMEANYAFRSEVDDSMRGPAGFIVHRADQYKRSLSFIMISNLLSSVQVMVRHVPPTSSWAPDGEWLIQNWKTADGEGNVVLLRNMTQLSARRTEFLETLIREARARGTKILLFVTPYRPDILFMIHEDLVAWSHHQTAVTYLQSLVARYGIAVLDYTNESTFGGDPADWYDGVHYTQRNAARLTRQVIHDGL